VTWTYEEVLTEVNKFRDSPVKYGRTGGDHDEFKHFCAIMEVWEARGFKFNQNMSVTYAADDSLLKWQRCHEWAGDAILAPITPRKTFGIYMGGDDSEGAQCIDWDRGLTDDQVSVVFDQWGGFGHYFRTMDEHNPNEYDDTTTD
jgi:hypothetical protein